MTFRFWTFHWGTQSQLQNLWSSCEAEAKLEGLSMHESHKATKYFIKFQQLAACIEWADAALHRQAYNGLAKHIKDDMVHHNKPPSQDSENLSKLSMHNTGNEKENSPVKPSSGSSGNESEQKSDSKKCDNKSEKVLPIQAEQQQLWLYPGQGSTSEQKKSTTPDLSSNLGRWKANSTGTSHCLDNHLCLFCAPLDTSPRTVQNPARLCQSPRIQVWSGQVHIFWHRLKKRLSSPQDSAQPEDCIELPHVKTLTLYTSTPLNPDSLTLFLTSNTLLDMVLKPLWIPDLPTPSLILCLFRLSIFQHMAFCLSSSNSSMEPPILSSHRN